ncbi:MAG: TerB family tellurite resistance protein [Pseudanabaenales cyanobacterium]|nr:TerB family tellurite resistance protein [Pseudanabaenales cyanobacterium]
MADPVNKKILLKILIGAAWIDGVIQPEERNYLHRVAKEHNLSQDPEIKPLLQEFVSVKPDQCYDWVRQYLGDRPSAEDCQNLIEASSALIYSDGEVAVEEAKFLHRIQLLTPEDDAGPEPLQKIALRAIRKLYQNWVNKQY